MIIGSKSLQYSKDLSLSEELSETRKLFGLLPFIAASLITGTTLVNDELDTKLHPVLLGDVVMLYNDVSINKHKGKLIFTTHDLSTMNSEVFRRDEFAAKENSQNA